MLVESSGDLPFSTNFLSYWRKWRCLDKKHIKEHMENNEMLRLSWRFLSIRRGWMWTHYNSSTISLLEIQFADLHAFLHLLHARSTALPIFCSAPLQLIVSYYHGYLIFIHFQQFWVLLLLTPQHLHPTNVSL